MRHRICCSHIGAPLLLIANIGINDKLLHYNYLCHYQHSRSVNGSFYIVVGIHFDWHSLPIDNTNYLYKSKLMSEVEKSSSDALNTESKRKHVLPLSTTLNPTAVVSMSEDSLKAFVGATSECIKLIRTDGTVQYINDAGASMVEAVSTGSVIGQSVFDFIVPEYRDQWKEQHRRVCNGETLSWQYDVVGLKGTRRTLITHAIPLTNADGTFYQLAVTRDISEQKRAEEALIDAEEKLKSLTKESEERFQNLANNIQNLAWIATGDGWVTWYNQRWYEYTGTTFEQLQGWGWQYVHHPDHVDRVADFMKEAWKKNEPFELTHLLRGKNGEYRWFLSRGTPIINAEGQVIQWIGTLTDIDEQTQAIEKFRQLSDEAPLCVWMTNTEGAITYANKETLAFLDYGNTTEITLKEWRNYIHPDDLEAAYAIITNAYRRQNPYSLECRVRNAATGQYEWFVFKSVPLIDIGVFAGYIGTANNIHSSRVAMSQLEARVDERTRELNEAIAALHQSNKDLERFAHVASHDLKEPLRKLRLYGDLLNKEYSSVLPERAKNYLEKMEQTAGRMNDLIEGILNYSSLIDGQELFGKVDLNIILTEIQTDLEVLIGQKQATIDIEKALPLVNGSPVLLNQLLYNIINNALKFSRPEIPPHIQISTGKASATDLAHNDLPPGKRFIVICIKDNGIGFHQEYAEKIFHSFSRLNARDKYEGTGLGLALCKRIAEQHGGAIEAEGVLGEGALFKVFLPEAV